MTLAEDVIGLLDGPCICRVRGDAQNVHTARLDLHGEQDVQAFEEHGVNDAGAGNVIRAGESPCRW